DAVRMPCRIRDGDRGRLGDAEQRESLQAHRIDDRLEIADPHVDRWIADVRVREPAASLVIADDGVAVAELLEPMAPHRALPLQLEMTEPGCDPDERRTAPVHGVSQAQAVPSRAEAHVLLHSLTVQLTVGDRDAASCSLAPGSLRPEAARPRTGWSGVMEFSCLSAVQYSALHEAVRSGGPGRGGQRRPGHRRPGPART